MADAKDFLPQSWWQVLLVADRDGTEIPEGMMSGRPNPAWHPKVLVTAVAAFPPSVAKRWVWWRLPRPALHRLVLAEMLDDDIGADRI